jgi:hypothetical protein
MRELLRKEIISALSLPLRPQRPLREAFSGLKLLLGVHSYPFTV